MPICGLELSTLSRYQCSIAESFVGHLDMAARCLIIHNNDSDNVLLHFPKIDGCIQSKF